MSEPVGIGIIGGSGLYQMEGLSVIEEKKIDTPFGERTSAGSRTFDSAFQMHARW